MTEQQQEQEQEQQEIKEDESKQDVNEENEENEDNEEDEDVNFEFPCPACSFLAAACKFYTISGIVMIPRDNISHIIEYKDDTTVVTKDGYKFLLISNIITNFFENGCVDDDTDDIEDDEDNEDNEKI